MGSHCIILASQIIDYKPTVNMIITCESQTTFCLFPTSTKRGISHCNMQCLDIVEHIYDIGSCSHTCLIHQLALMCIGMHAAMINHARMYTCDMAQDQTWIFYLHDLTPFQIFLYTVCMRMHEKLMMSCNLSSHGERMCIH